MEQSELDKRQEDEAKFLACCMGTDNFQDKIRGISKADNYFSKIEYAELFKILMKSKTGNDINFAFILQGLKAKNIDTNFFTPLYGKSIPSTHIKFYFKAIKEAYTQQKTKELINLTVAKMKGQGYDINDVLNGMSKGLSLLQESTNESRSYHIAECLEEGMKIIENKLFKDNGLVGLPSGIPKYDKLTRGFQPGRLYVIGARPANGKSTLAMNLAAQIGMHTPTAIFSLEMSKGSLAAKLIQIKAMIDLYDIKEGQASESYAKAADVLEDYIASNITINASSYQTLETFTSEVRKLHREGKCECVIFDYIGLISSSTKGQKEQDKLSDFSRACKILAGELGIPVILLTQLNRDLEKDGGRKPRKSDIRSSGSIEQDADAITFIHNLFPNDPYNTKFVLVHDKERDGMTGDVAVTFEKKYQTFEAGEFDN